jgi:putative ABC transport system permease protein
MRPHPPRWAIRWLQAMSDVHWQDEIIGDLEEQFLDDLKKVGRTRAAMIFWWETIRFIRPHIFKRSQKLNTTFMTLNHIKISYRNLLRNKVYAFINILGLSVGIASVILIGLYIQFETSYDNFFDDSDRIYRVALHRVYPGRTKEFGTSGVRVAPILNENYAQVEKAARLHRLYFQNEITVTFEENDNSFIETKYLFADSLYFDLFSYPFLHGDRETALDQSESVILTQSTAMKYYGEEDVVGRTLEAFDTTLVVSGVIEDIPANSHIHFDLLSPTSLLGFINAAERNDDWTSPWVYTYVKLRPGADPMELEAQFDEMVKTYGNAGLSTNLGEDWYEKGHMFEYYLQPITDIHLHSKTDVEVEPNSDIAYVYILTVVALIILIISTINFVNLSIARSTERAKEVGIRKVLGSYRRNLIGQFLIEAILISSVSAVMALGFLFLFIPRFNSLLGTFLDFSVLANPLMILSVLSFIAMVGTLSGLYPALAISAMEPTRVLKGSYKSSKGGVWLRDALIVFQFLISIIMISGSITADQQMSYLQDKNLGFNKENLLVVKQSFALGDNYRAFVNEIKGLNGVEKVGGANMVPGEFHGSNVFRVSNPDIADLRVNTSSVDDEYIDAIEFNIIAGRGFQREFNDSLSIIINESAVKAMGISNEEALKLRFQATVGNRQEVPALSIVGVVEDYNFYSLHSEITPMVIFNGNTGFLPTNTVIRTRTQNISEIISQVETQWQTLTDEPFSFSFLDQDLQRQYEADQNTALIFKIFTYIAIIMSCVGLFGLATYVVNQRSKEMSVRKVLGASIIHIISVFSREFIILIGIAFIIGVPMAYLALTKWLENFAYHVDIGAFYFLLAGFLTLLMVLITVSYQALKIARVNPVKMLRSE